MSDLWDYRFTVGPGTARGAYLDLLSFVGGQNDLYIHHARVTSTHHQFACLVRRLQGDGLEVCDVYRSQRAVEEYVENPDAMPNATGG